MKKTILLLFCVAVFMTVFAGCAPAEQTPPETISQAPAETAAQEESATPSAQAEGNADTKQMTDMAGRTVQIPSVVSKAYGTDPVGTITLYTLAPEKLIGWNYNLNDQEKQYIMEEYQALPVYGMKDDFNAEAVIAAQPDVIIQMGSTNEKAAAQADELQTRLDIPVVVLSGKMTDIPSAYELLGEITGDGARAKELANYSQTALSRAQGIEITPEDKVTVYYGNGVDSTETAPLGSDAAEVIEMAGGVNIADLQVEDPNERMTVTKEQILAWNPDFMFVNGEPKKEVSGAGAAQTILSDSDYASLTAVKNGNVYGIPKSPFAWLDRPKAPNRIIGLVWAGATMYPQLYEGVDVTKEIQDFYDLFYHMQLSEEQVAQLLDS